MNNELLNNDENKRLDIILNDNTNTSLKIGDKAPLFNADTTFGNIKLSDYQGKWLILFSHPGDFTPVVLYKLNNYIIFFNHTLQFM